MQQNPKVSNPCGLIGPWCQCSGEYSDLTSRIKTFLEQILVFLQKEIFDFIHQMYEGIW
jgi:hypothetical protein